MLLLYRFTHVKMFSCIKSMSKLINSNYFRFRSFILLNRALFITNNDYRHLTKASLLPRYLVLNYLNLNKFNMDNFLENKRYFSKKKGSKRIVETEEESDSDDEEYEQNAGDDETIGDNIIKKNVSSLRIDSVIKAGLGLSKKKIEQEFYAFKLRVNGKPVVKKAINMYIGDEVDVVKGFSPDTSKYLTVDRIIIKGIDKVTGTGQFPVIMEVLKQLTIENYEEPWNPASVGQLDK